MESLFKLHQCQQPLHLPLNSHRPSFPNPIASLYFRSPLPSSSTSSKSVVIRASSSSLPLPQKPQKNSPCLEALSPISSSFIKTTCITLASAALFLMRFNVKPVIAAPIAVPMMETSKNSTTDNVSLEERERAIEARLSVNPNDIDALQSIMEVKIKSNKLEEAIVVIDRLIEIEPEEYEWRLLKAHVNRYRGEFELAKQGFEDILTKDPLRVDAYHGIVMAASDSGDSSLEDVMKRIEEAMEKCKKERKNDVRDFKLLIAQMKVVEGNYVDALKIYQELVSEEPRDFRPYLCQGIIYTLLRKNDEAEKQFEKYRRLVPKNHPYAEYLDENLYATKLFSHKVERDGASSNI